MEKLKIDKQTQKWIDSLSPNDKKIVLEGFKNHQKIHIYASKPTLKELEKSVKEDELNNQKLITKWSSLVDSFIKGKYLEWEDYNNDLSVRTAIQENIREFSSEMKKKVESIDNKFRKIFVPGEPWISREYAAKHYPKDVYWWYYGNPRNAPWLKETKK